MWSFCDLSIFTSPFFDIFLLGRQSSIMKSDKLYSMGSSFDERSDDESSYELKVPRNNSSKSLTIESIPLVSKWFSWVYGWRVKKNVNERMFMIFKRWKLLQWFSVWEGMCYEISCVSPVYYYLWQIRMNFFELFFKLGVVYILHNAKDYHFGPPTFSNRIYSQY